MQEIRFLHKQATAFYLAMKKLHFTVNIDFLTCSVHNSFFLCFTVKYMHF